MGKTIGIVGSRRRVSQADSDAIKGAFAKVYENGDRIVSGGCRTGGDAVAESIARFEEVPITIHYARWKTLGKAAGFIRNGDIAQDADILIACVAADRTGGTEDTITKFLKHGNIPTEQEAIGLGALILV
jgi:hypothetical protein